MPQLDLEKKRQSQRDWYQRNKETEKTRTAGRRDILRKENKQRIDALKEATPCADCKLYFPAVCMDFDHLGSEVKVKEISRMLGLNWPKIEVEIAKCEIVCACCHRVRTRDRLRCSMGELADPPGSEPGDSRFESWASSIVGRISVPKLALIPVSCYRRLMDEDRDIEEHLAWLRYILPEDTFRAQARPLFDDTAQMNAYIDAPPETGYDWFGNAVP